MDEAVFCTLLSPPTVASMLQNIWWNLSLLVLNRYKTIYENKMLGPIWNVANIMPNVITFLLFVSPIRIITIISSQSAFIFTEYAYVSCVAPFSNQNSLILLICAMNHCYMKDTLVCCIEAISNIVGVAPGKLRSKWSVRLQNFLWCCAKAKHLQLTIENWLP